MTIIGESYCNLTCRCGHTADLDEFKRTPINGELPADTFQCPACRRAWRMVVVKESRWLEGGLYIPPGRQAQTIPTIL